MSSTQQNSLISTAENILSRTTDLSQRLSQQSITPPSDLSLNASSALWTIHDGEIQDLRSSILALTQHLDRLLDGPHGFLHEYISTNWEYGALYTLLEYDILEKIPLETGAAPVAAAQLAEDSGLPAEKLLRICRLVATAGILEEPREGYFGHTAISETLVRDEGYRSFIRFQLFETRVASAHLADSLRGENPFWTGWAAFEHAWGMPMYEWHAKNPEKGKRFAQAMESVSKNLDPGNGMIINWLTHDLPTTQTGNQPPLLIEISGKTGAFSTYLATLFPNLNFEIEDSSAALLSRGQESLSPSLTDRIKFTQRDLFAERSPSTSTSTSTIFLLRGVLWNLADNDAITLLRNLLPALRTRKDPVLLISDLVSPAWGTFEPHIERAFRRRDVTLMTMHNVKQRTAREWDELIRSASEELEITYREKYSSHSCRGLWEIHLNTTITTNEEPVNGNL